MNIYRVIRFSSFIVASALMSTAMTSCFTGIENTKKIELTRQDKRQLTLSPEEIFLKDLEGHPLKDWQPGDPYLIADPRIALILESDGLMSPEDTSLVGRHLSFVGVDTRLRPDRSEECLILLSDSIRTYRFPTGMDPAKADTAMVSTKLPMLIDLQTVSEVNSRMKGRELWTRSQLWYDADGEKINGRKFAPVTVTAISPGSQLFPIKVFFTDENGAEAMMWMNYTSSTSDSRRFPVLFSLTDRRKDYPDISDEHWRLIQNGDITKGMTKLECRLSLGNPTDVAAGHTHSETLDVWQYSDGVYLRFADGLLVDFRR
ncbi:MAG: hypothetical protein HDS67_02120 [Bacteroidales bacterium]|nr:hypothetical protein [Bacteroidales bacterium]